MPQASLFSLRLPIDFLCFPAILIDFGRCLNPTRRSYEKKRLSDEIVVRHRLSDDFVQKEYLVGVGVVQIVLNNGRKRLEIHQETT